MWNFNYKGNVHRVRMIPVITLSIGDAQGNHKLDGMYGKFFDVERVNHSCNCPWKESDNPKVSCQFMNHSHVNKLSVEGRDEELKNISHHNISNAFEML